MKFINRAKDVVGTEDKQSINDAVFELQAASRILTSVMLYNPLKTMSSSSDSSS